MTIFNISTGKQLFKEVGRKSALKIIVPSSADSRCETCERIVLLLLFVAYQQHGKEPSKVHFKLRQLMCFSGCGC